MSKEYFDVIVLGAGPAGLGSSLHLAEKGVSVLLLEKEKIGTTQKTWLTFDYIIKKYSLQECIRNRFSEIAFSCYLGNIYSFEKREFIYPVHEEKVLRLLAQRAHSKGVIIKDEEPFINYSTAHDGNVVSIKTTKNTYYAKLAVDAMGRYSPILRSHGLQNATLDMGCLAFFLKNVGNKNNNRLLLYDSFFPGPDYFWVIPLEGDEMMVGTFSFSSLTDKNFKAKAEKLKFYMEARKIKGEIFNTKMGNIPLGGQTNLNTENFICIGDSCNTPLPSSGFSFSRCLEESRVLADFAVKYLENKARIRDYKKEILSEKIPAIEIHLIISDMLSKFTDPMLNKAIGAMNELEEDFIISLLTGRDMSINFTVKALRAILNTFSLAEIRSLSLKQNYLKNMVNLYNLLPAFPQARVGEQLVKFVTGVIKDKYPFLTK